MNNTVNSDNQNTIMNEDNFTYLSFIDALKLQCWKKTQSLSSRKYIYVNYLKATRIINST